ncbi:hypothetical protein HPP92_009694 [Vanilla planifolia]|uniref:Uncharacterized protein n=1 Tax=Vanilla planifolia TaxID=51239 RepID=A0A835R512_VANPL|nr:hypothetical protein HPP92_009694 [Vanilla planifolia]
MGPLENGDFEEDPGGRVPGAAWGRSTIPAGRPIAIEVVRSGQRQSGTDPGRPHVPQVSPSDAKSCWRSAVQLGNEPGVSQSWPWKGQAAVTFSAARTCAPARVNLTSPSTGAASPDRRSADALQRGVGLLRPGLFGPGMPPATDGNYGGNLMRQYGGQWNLEEGPWMFVQGCSTRLYSLPTNLDEDLLPPGWIMGQSGGPVTSTPTTIQSPQGRRAIELLSGKESSSQMVETKPEEAIQPSLCHGLCRRLLPTSPGCRSAAGDQAQGFHFTPIGTRPPLLPTSASSPGREDSGGILQCVTTTHEGDDHSSLYAVQWWTTSRFGVSIAATMVEDWL